MLHTSTVFTTVYSLLEGRNGEGRGREGSPQTYFHREAKSNAKMAKCLRTFPNMTTKPSIATTCILKHAHNINAV